MCFKNLYSHQKVLMLLSCFLFLFVTEQSFANISVPINGKVESYKKGVYTVRTSGALIYIKKSKLSYSLDQKLSKSIGSKIQVDVPPSVISSSRGLSRSRQPSSEKNSKK